ncbi:MAG TPA: CheR family methyltransferase [Blastocatellia bacterium]|nr:CheR family methyltransferase [Blastocatellia bacterium]
MSSPDEGAKFSALLDYLKRTRGFDFSGYKRPSLMRRIERRMDTLGISGFDSYVDYLEVHTQEFYSLFNTILINVTDFFRDPASWEYVTSDVVPRIIESKKDNGPIRIWSAGCASGEEVYTAVMVMTEALGPEAVRERVKFFATDVDKEALNQARLANYSSKDVANLPPGLIDKYFDRTDSRFIFKKELRRTVIFGRNDLIQDAPISRVDLLICRNTLMYFNASAQGRILANFHFALNPHGYLFLGKSEMLLTHGSLFTPAEIKKRVFLKNSQAMITGDRRVIRSGDDGDASHGIDGSRMREVAFDAGPAAQVVVDASGNLAFANQLARSMFGLMSKDLGSPLQSLEMYYRPVELRSRIGQVYAGRRLILLKNVEWISPSLGQRALDVQLVPLIDGDGSLVGVSISFDDKTTIVELQRELERSKQEMDSAYEELQSTNEELETTNEELQSTNEELETTNEELQSSNEELETTNEELQSTNQELEIINIELSDRTSELNHTNAFLEAVLRGISSAVIVIDNDMLVTSWNRRSEDMWGLRADEVLGRHFLSLDIGLPVEQLKQPIKACLAKEDDFRELSLEATNRRGKKVNIRATTTPLVGNPEQVLGAILLIEEGSKDEDLTTAPSMQE